MPQTEQLEKVQLMQPGWQWVYDRKLGCLSVQRSELASTILTYCSRCKLMYRARLVPVSSTQANISFYQQEPLNVQSVGDICAA